MYNAPSNITDRTSGEPQCTMLRVTLQSVPLHVYLPPSLPPSTSIPPSILLLLSGEDPGERGAEDKGERGVLQGERA